MFKLLCQLEKAEVAKAFHYSCIFPKMKVINLNVFSWRKSLLLYNENLMLCGSTTMKNVPSALRFQCYYLDGFRSCKIKNMAALCCWMKTRDDQGEAAIKFVQNFAKNTKSIRAEKLQFQKLSRSSLSSKSENLAGAIRVGEIIHIKCGRRRIHHYPAFCLCLHLQVRKLQYPKPKPQ